MTGEQITYTPGQRLLGEALRATQDYLAITESQAVAIVLYSAATHAIKSFPAFGRLFFSANGPESGKTQGLTLAALLSSRPLNANGTTYAVNAALAAATNSPEQPVPTLYRDEISDVFGRSGLNKSKDTLSAALREGYKRGATTMWSVGRVAENISIYVPIIMAGLGTAIPTDIRSRCVVIGMERGKPRRSLDSDGAEDRVRMIGRALGAEVRKHARELQGVTFENTVPGLEGRKHLVWRPLLAVAQAVGGELWLSRAVRAFKDLTEGGETVEVLSADQHLLKELVAILDEFNVDRDDFVAGRDLCVGLSALDRFKGRTLLSISHDVADVMPTDPELRRWPTGTDDPRRGYWVRDIYDAWEAVKPAAPEDALPTADVSDPFGILA